MGEEQKCWRVIDNKRYYGYQWRFRAGGHYYGMVIAGGATEQVESGFAWGVCKQETAAMIWEEARKDAAWHHGEVVKGSRGTLKELIRAS